MSTTILGLRATGIAIDSIIRPQYISFPRGEELKAVVEGFENEWGVPQCVGAIDGSHIPILRHISVGCTVAVIAHVSPSGSKVHSLIGALRIQTHARTVTAPPTHAQWLPIMLQIMPMLIASYCA